MCVVTEFPRGSLICNAPLCAKFWIGMDLAALRTYTYVLWVSSKVAIQPGPEDPATTNYFLVLLTTTILHFP